MSAIDQYKHKHLGFIECPSTSDFVYNSKTKKIAIYELLENIPHDEKDFDGKIGDIILGGGSGEAPAFRISMPEAISFFTNKNLNNPKNYSDLFRAFWSPTQSYNLCEGFLKNGWSPNIPIEIWLAENVWLLLINNIEDYFAYKSNIISNSVLEYDKP